MCNKRQPLPHGHLGPLADARAQASTHLTTSLHLSPRTSLAHRAHILTYLIPCRLLLPPHLLPTPLLLSPHPSLRRQLGPLAAAVRRGDLAGFDAALAAGLPRFARRRTHLTLERGRDVALRNLFRSVFVAGGGATRVAVPVAEFQAAIALRSASSDVAAGTGAPRVPGRDEVECLIANMIYKVCCRSSRLVILLAGKRAGAWTVTVADSVVWHAVAWRGGVVAPPACPPARPPYIGLHQGLHPPRARARRPVQEERRVPRHGHMK